MSPLKNKIDNNIKASMQNLINRATVNKYWQRLEIPIDDIPMVMWLKEQSNWAKVYWANRDDGFIAAGLGVANFIKCSTGSISNMEKTLTSSSLGIRYYGGMRFLNQACSEDWKSFGQGFFILPKWEMRLVDGQQTLAYHFKTKDQLAMAYDELEKISFVNMDEDCLGVPAVEEQKTIPDFSQWRQQLQDTLQYLTTDQLKKVVLARKSDYKITRNNQWLLLQRWQKRNENTYIFCFQPQQGISFIGASPECLYRRRGNEIYTEAIAATRPRSCLPEEDSALEQELIESKKDRYEHVLVVDYLNSCLKQLCISYYYEDIKTLKLKYLQHLWQTFRGILKPGVTDTDILSVLHPTPAVGGNPRKKALEWITQTENFDRGWYSGPVGWIDGKNSEFAVAIRSGLVQKDKISVYAGVGLVDKSCFKEEWQEMNNKIGNFFS